MATDLPVQRSASSARAAAFASKPPRAGMSSPASRTTRPSASLNSARSVTPSTRAEPEATPQAAAVAGAHVEASAAARAARAATTAERLRTGEIVGCAGAEDILACKRSNTPNQ
jgi:hypothetical protein